MLNRKILLVRPKQTLADDGNYREARFFSSWKHKNKLTEFTLPGILQKATGQSVVPFGYGVLKTVETLIASEICEELWTPDCPNVELALAGVEIFTNGSGSHHQLRKLNSRLSLMTSATSKSGGVYMYSNHRGGDGGRLYFDGSSLICLNGEVLEQASQFSLKDVEVIYCTVDLADVRSYRQGTNSFQEHSSRAALMLEPLIVTSADLKSYNLCYSGNLRRRLSTAKAPRIHTPEEECALGPACWMWDYLRRSGAAGFLLPLSGGADSAAGSPLSQIVFIVVIGVL
jgi:NAD+ synthase (glutamine-hydrolysing)